MSQTIPKIREIQAVVADVFDVPIAEMQSAKKAWHVARPRQVAMCLSRELTRHTLSTIGYYFGGRHYTTVLWAIRGVEKLCAIDPKFRSRVEQCRAAAKPPIVYT